MGDLERKRKDGDNKGERKREEKEKEKKGRVKAWCFSRQLGLSHYFKKLWVTT